MNTPSFEWDPNKAELNLEKHGIAFEEATSVFADPMFITVVDDEIRLMKNDTSLSACQRKDAC